jgi:hypothetical protein
MNENIGSPKLIIETFRIIPTTQSILGSMILVILLFLTYILFIGWTILFDTKTTPNMSMLSDFIFDNHEKTIDKFQKYIISVLQSNLDSSESFESFENKYYFVEPKTSYFSKTIKEFNVFVSGITTQMMGILESGFQRVLLMVHLRGNKFVVNKTTD